MQHGAIRVGARAGVQILQDEVFVLGYLKLIELIHLQLTKQVTVIKERALHQLAQADGSRDFPGGTLPLQQRVGAMRSRCSTDHS